MGKKGNSIARKAPLFFQEGAKRRSSGSGSGGGQQRTRESGRVSEREICLCLSPPKEKWCIFNNG